MLSNGCEHFSHSSKNKAAQKRHRVYWITTAELGFIPCKIACQRRGAGVAERGRLEICCLSYEGPWVRIPPSPPVAAYAAKWREADDSIPLCPHVCLREDGDFYTASRFTTTSD